MCAGTNDILPNEDGLGAVGRRISAKLFGALRQKCTGDALAMGWARGRCDVNPQVQPQGVVAGRVRLLEQKGKAAA